LSAPDTTARACPGRPPPRRGMWDLQMEPPSRASLTTAGPIARTKTFSYCRPRKFYVVVRTERVAPSRRKRNGEMGIERMSGDSNTAEVLDRVLDKGIVIEAWVRVVLMGIDLITLQAHVVVASIDTYLQFTEAVAEGAPVSTPRGTARAILREAPGSHSARRRRWTMTNGSESDV